MRNSIGETMKDVQAHEVRDNLDPILLFTVVDKEKVERGVYYVPQRGVGMPGVPFDGSTVTVALRISNMGNVTIQPGVIDIPKVNVDAIVKAVNDWMRTWMGKGEEKPVKEDDDSEDDIDPDLI